MQNHKYSLSDIEMMIPWEREIYITMLSDDIKAMRDEQNKQSMR
jgi:hypothetical protein